MRVLAMMILGALLASCGTTRGARLPDDCAAALHVREEVLAKIDPRTKDLRQRVIDESGLAPCDRNEPTTGVVGFDAAAFRARLQAVLDRASPPRAATNDDSEDDD